MMSQGYIRRVDRTLKKLREYLLGLDTQLVELLPQKLRTAETEQQSAYLADRLLFCLAAEETLDENELRSSRNWLYEAILYLLSEADDSDHDLSSILMMFNLSQEVRELMLDSVENPDNYLHIKTELEPPICQEELEAAMLRLEPNISRAATYERLKSYFVHQD